MVRRLVLVLGCAVGLLLAPGAALADVSSPGEHIVPAEVVFTGLRDFPQYRFVIALVPFNDSLNEARARVTPTPVRDGEPAKADTSFFQQLRAIPADTPDPVTDAWLASSKTPSSGSFTRHPFRVLEGGPERVVRSRFQVRQVKAGWISLEFLSSDAVLADGSERPLARPIPRSFTIDSFTSPPGWKLFLMPDPAWPRADPPLPATPCAPGDVLSLSPGPRTLVAVQGSPGPDGSLDGKPFVTWGSRLDPWHRADVGPESTTTEERELLAIEVKPGSPLDVARSELYRDGKGTWFYDELLHLPVETSRRWWPLAAGGAAGVLLVSAWALLRRRRRRAT